MLKNLINKSISFITGGTKQEKDLKSLYPYVGKVNEAFAALASLSDDQLRARTQEVKDQINAHLKNIDDQIAAFHQQLKDQPSLHPDKKEEIFAKIDALELERNKELEIVLDQVLPQAFAIVKDTARRLKEFKQLTVTATDFDKEVAARRAGVEITADGKAIWANRWLAAGTEVIWDMMHYDVQIIGGVVLHQGKISEMATGEGKTLVATLPAFLNALAGRGVHIVTVNDYLAKRDSQWMAPIFEFHGMRVDCIDRYEPHSEERKRAYLSDITYGTNNEFGFDYLRDNMVRDASELVQRKHHYAMVDEVDSVLVDDARTPLIISGPIPKGDQQEYVSYKPRVERLYEEQKKLVQQFLIEAKKLISEGNENEGGLALYRAYRGLPKYKPLIKFLSETGIKNILQKTEYIYLAENSRRMPEADEPLLFSIDEKNSSVILTEKGTKIMTSHSEDPNFFLLPNLAKEMGVIEKDRSITDEDKAVLKEQLIEDYRIKATRIHTVNQLLKAYTLFEKEVDYVLLEGKVKIVDEQTGRILEGRRYSDGLHQAIEAKEGVKVEAATQTYATITLQNYFRMYHKLAGMTGTAETEAGEFWEIYKLDVVVIPTNKKVVRNDMNDKVYRTTLEKLNAVADEILQLTKAGRPVLVGTTSVQSSEAVSRLLQMKGVKHQVLNAKHHAKEAEIVASAGLPGTVTIATNMAGRGTDIKLTKESRDAGGLAIIGTERHESRRVDRQLRGRSGRQGDPGSSQFFLSLEDGLMRLFGSERVAKVMDTMGFEKGEVIEHSMITRSIEKAQKKVEENNFGIRKRLLEYDDVMNQQREVIYKRRRNALYGDRLGLDVMNMFYDTIRVIVRDYRNDYEGFKIECLRVLGMSPEITEPELRSKDQNELTLKLYRQAYTAYVNKGKEIIEKSMPVLSEIHAERGEEVKEILIPFTDGKRNMMVAVDLEEVMASQGRSVLTSLEQNIVLSFIDDKWKDHLREMDDLRQQVRMASLEQKDPLMKYKKEGFNLFQIFISEVNMEAVNFLSKGKVQEPNAEDPRIKEELERQRIEHMRELQRLQTNQSDFEEEEEAAENGGNTAKAPVKRQPIVSQKSFGRNDKVDVRYQDGTVKRGMKFKSIEADLASGTCILLGPSAEA